MHKSVVLVLVLSVCSLAAPVEKSKEASKTVELDRPSPINPDIPSDPKPEEKITLITDPKVQPLVTPAPTKLPGPLVLPRVSLVRAKREEKDSSESDEKSSEEEKKPAEKNTPEPPTPHVSSTTHSSVATVSEAGSSSTAVHPTNPRIPYAPRIHHHNEHLFKPTTETHSSASPSTSPSTTAAPSQNHANDKRDIPVPLTRKNPASHDDEAKPKEEPSPSVATVPKEKINQEEENGKDKDNKEQHPTTFARPIPVAELFAKKPSTE